MPFFRRNKKEKDTRFRPKSENHKDQYDLEELAKKLSAIAEALIATQKPLNAVVKWMEQYQESISAFQSILKNSCFTKELVERYLNPTEPAYAASDNLKRMHKLIHWQRELTIAQIFDESITLENVKTEKWQEKPPKFKLPKTGTERKGVDLFADKIYKAATIGGILSEPDLNIFATFNGFCEPFSTERQAHRFNDARGRNALETQYETLLAKFVKIDFNQAECYKELETEYQHKRSFPDQKAIYILARLMLLFEKLWTTLSTLRTLSNICFTQAFIMQFARAALITSAQYALLNATKTAFTMHESKVNPGIQEQLIEQTDSFAKQLQQSINLFGTNKSTQNYYEDFTKNSLRSTPGKLRQHADKILEEKGWITKFGPSLMRHGFYYQETAAVMLPQLKEDFQKLVQMIKAYLPDIPKENLSKERLTTYGFRQENIDPVIQSIAYFQSIQEPLNELSGQLEVLETAINRRDAVVSDFVIDNQLILSPTTSQDDIGLPSTSTP